MNVILNREKLIDILNNFTAIVKDNSVRPMLSGIKIKAQNNIVEFYGTNLDVSGKASISGNIVEEGEVVFKFNLALEYLKLLDNEEINIKVDNKRLYIHKAEFSIYEESNFPLIHDLKDNQLVTISGSEMIKAIECVKFASFPISTKLELNAVRFVFRNNNIILYGTDSYRLTKYVIKEKIENIEASFSCPLESANIITKLFKDSENISLCYDGSQFQISDENFILMTRMIELDYPDIESIFNNFSFDKTIEIKKLDLELALKKILTVAKRNFETRDGAIFDFKRNILQITATSGHAKAIENIDIIKEGDDLKTSLNAKFLLEFLQFTNKNIVIQAQSSSSMFYLKEVENDNYSYIIMPINMKN